MCRILVCCYASLCLFADGGPHRIVDALLTWAKHSKAHHSAVPRAACLGCLLVSPVSPIVSHINRNDQLQNNQISVLFFYAVKCFLYYN